MDLNEQDFFHQATNCICGSLDIKKTATQSFQYLKKFFPLDFIEFVIFNRNYKNIRFIAIADAFGGLRTNKIVSFPPDLIYGLQKRNHPKTVTVYNCKGKDSLENGVLNFLGYNNFSMIIVPLRPDDIKIGAVVLRVQGKDKYTDEHCRLINLLHDPFSIALSNTLRYEELQDLKNTLIDDNQYLSRELQFLSFDEIIGSDLGLKNVMALVQQVAPRDNAVLLLGETGVGKEVIANAIHYSSFRKDGPFIKLNCGAIPENLIDSELFGHEKGAFTGATTQKRGRFERAEGGTLFLDEIGELPMQAQIRLLRVLQYKELERVGGTKTIRVNTRIIAATHRNLEHMVSQNKFREDLWYRLNLFPIMIPPLRQRKADIPLLVKYFIKRKSKDLNLHNIPEIERNSIDQLKDLPWKGNVRELENMVERALIQHNGGLMKFDDLISYQKYSQTALDYRKGKFLNLDEANARHIESALEVANGKINGPGGAAELLGIHHSTLRFKMDKLGIKYGRKSRYETFTVSHQSASTHTE